MENKDEKRPVSKAAEGRLIQTKFPEERPILWGPNQDTTYPDTYNEPSDWREKQLLRIPQVVRFISGKGKSDNSISRLIHLGSRNVAVIRIRTADIDILKMPIREYLYLTPFVQDEEISSEVYNANKSTLELLEMYHAVAKTAMFSEFTDEVAYYTVFSQEWVGGSRVPYYVPADDMTYSLVNIVTNGGYDLPGPSFTYDFTTDLPPIPTTPEHYIAFKATGNIGDLSQYEQNRLKYTIHFYLEHFAFGIFQVNSLSATREYDWDKPPPYPTGPLIPITPKYSRPNVEVTLNVDPG